MTTLALSLLRPALCALGLWAPVPYQDADPVDADPQSAVPAKAVQHTKAHRYLTQVHELGWTGTVLVEQQGQLLHLQGYGLAQREEEIPCGPDTLYEIASITKPITATAILLLAEEGRLSLDDSIAKHLPGVPRSHAKITLEHLLAHTSGMPRGGTSGSGEVLQAAVKTYCSSAPVRAAGEAYEYWNGGYALLAGVVEQVSGQTFQQFCQQRIFQPAGMRSSGFAGDAFPTEQQARGHRPGPKNDGPTVGVRLAAEHAYQGSYGWHYKGMGGCVTHAVDLWRFLRAFREGEIVSPGTVRNMWTERQAAYGLGWGIAHNTPNETRRIGHGGDVAGFHSSLQYLPEDGITIIVLGNQPAPAAWKIAWDLEALLLGHEPSQVPLPVTEAPPSGPYAALDGVYEHSRWGRLRILARDQGVRAQFRGRKGVQRILRRKWSRAETKASQRMQDLMEAMVAGRVDAFCAHIAPPIPESWGQLVVQTLWPGQTTRYGENKHIEVVEVRALPQDQMECWIAVDHARRGTWVRAFLREGKLSFLEFEPQEIPAPFELPLEPHGSERLRFLEQDGVESFTIEWKASASAPKAVQWIPKRGKRITWKRIDS